MQITARLCPNCRGPAPQSSDGTLRAIGSAEARANTTAANPRLTRRQTFTIATCGAVVAVGSLIPWAGSGIFTAGATNGNAFVSLVAGAVMMAAARFGFRRDKRTGSVVTLIAAGISFYVAFDTARELTDDVSANGHRTAGRAGRFPGRWDGGGAGPID